MKGPIVLFFVLLTVFAAPNVATESIREVCCFQLWRKQSCVSELNQARIRLDEFLYSFGSTEPQRLSNEYTAILKKFANLNVGSTGTKIEDDDTATSAATSSTPFVSPCPAPSPTLFPPVTPTTTPSSNTSSSASASDSPSASPSASSTPSGPVEREEPRASANSYKMTAPIPHFMGLPPNHNPFFKWISLLKKYLENEKDVCHGPTFTNLNSITEEQYWGFISMLAVNAGEPLCFICNEIVALIKQLLGELGITLSLQEKLFLEAILALSPNTNGICQLLIPSCFASNTTFLANTTNTRNATECLKCSVCKSALFAVQSYVFLDPEMFGYVELLLQAFIVPNICTEYCIFTNQTTWDQQKAAQKLLMPDPFCHMVFKSNGNDWCPVSSTPNMVKCLRDYCITGFPAFMKPICELLFPAPNVNFKTQKAMNNDMFMNIKNHVEL